MKIIGRAVAGFGQGRLLIEQEVHQVSSVPHLPVVVVHGNPQLFEALRGSYLLPLASTVHEPYGFILPPFSLRPVAVYPEEQALRILNEQIDVSDPNDTEVIYSLRSCFCVFSRAL